MTYKALALFDIDGTLLRRAGVHHREALVHGIRHVTGLATTTEGLPLYGMLDPDILAGMMRQAGAGRALIRQSMPAIISAAERRYLRICPPLDDKHCPAVERTLDRLARHGVLLGLVTGNLTRIGWRKLEQAGLCKYFLFGAFGEMARTRTALVKLAVREALRRGWISRGAPMSLIGDAPADVIAARRNGLCAIAVRTGITPVEDLFSEGPDYLLSDLRHLRLRMLGV
ncbi:MAG: haloacid dehalogenase-like hydrolase [Bryobacteraceae bacterium]